MAAGSQLSVTWDIAAWLSFYSNDVGMSVKSTYINIYVFRFSIPEQRRTRWWKKWRIFFENFNKVLSTKRNHVRNMLCFGLRRCRRIDCCALCSNNENKQWNKNDKLECFCSIRFFWGSGGSRAGPEKYIYNCTKKKNDDWLWGIHQPCRYSHS